MILVAGLSPAWQQIVVLDELRVGEVNRAREVQWCASGKVLNVGIALGHLERADSCVPGAEHPALSTEYPVPSTQHACRTLAVVGGPGGDAIQREFADLGIAARWIVSQSPTRVCTTILDRAHRTTTELVENAGPIAADELRSFRSACLEEAARADVVVLTGSLPAGVPPTLYRDLMRATSGCVIVDVQGPPLLAALEARPFVVKPNREELGRTLGRELATDADLHAAMFELNRRGAEWVVVTQGKHAVWASHNSNVRRAEPPFVDVVNPIGCGDCLAAGLAWGLARGLQVPAALLRGIAAASENARQLLPGRLESARVEAIANTLACERIVG